MIKNNDSIITTVLPEAFHSMLGQLYLFLVSIFAKKKSLIFHESMA